MDFELRTRDQALSLVERHLRGELGQADLVLAIMGGPVSAESLTKPVLTQEPGLQRPRRKRRWQTKPAAESGPCELTVETAPSGKTQRQWSPTVEDEPGQLDWLQARVLLLMKRFSGKEACRRQVVARFGHIEPKSVVAAVQALAAVGAIYAGSERSWEVLPKGLWLLSNAKPDDMQWKKAWAWKRPTKGRFPCS